MTNPLDALFPSNDRIAPGAASGAASPHDGDMVTIARRFNPIEAELLRGRLAADGIPAVLGDAHTVQTDSLLTAALGGVRVRVPTSYERQALRAIADIDGGALMLAEDADVSGTPDPADDDRAAAFAASRRDGLPRAALATAAALVFLGVLAAFAS